MRPGLKKLNKNMFFLIEKPNILIKNKKIDITSLTASQQPLFVVPEHMTHPVYVYCVLLHKKVPLDEGLKLKC